MRMTLTERKINGEGGEERFGRRKLEVNHKRGRKKGE